MYPSSPRLVRVIRRTKIPNKTRVGIIPPLLPTTRAENRVTLMDALKQRKEELGAHYPSNIRLEPMLDKRVFKPVAKEHRTALKDMLRER
ncbi:hypothetical protein NEOLEDRAFT_1060926 [Neolentinus lepideus HHB14362 ss-1]|uniref:Uncharacterized protein n=1 Tax=Neolentinus lepideus HHB14362 ss-1 TaxID=1314782 RepID=A0A165U087_9AGAM|nr:hypothetical protein NEOLEDRAFT_1060926 [Neolentinus lepideus HHB14362 ss-1]